MTRNARAGRLSPAARRDQLLQHAVVVFAGKGLNEARHADLAKAAAVSLPTVFHYFPTRDALQAAVLAEVSSLLLEGILAREARLPGPATDAIERILLSFCAAIETHPNHIRLWLEWSVSVRGSLWEAYLGFYGGALAGIGRLLARGKRQGCIARGVGSADASRVIVGLAHMVAQMKFAGSRENQIAHTVHSLVHGYLANDR